MYQYRPGGFFHMPPIIKNLIILNVLVYIAQETFRTKFNLENYFALHDLRSVYFRPHQLITYMFMHANWPHLLMNMLFLWVFGSILEDEWGPKRFLTFCVISGLGAAVAQMITIYIDITPIWNEFHRLPMEWQMENLGNNRIPINTYTVGASGIVFGVMAAAGYLFPNRPIYIYLIPLKTIWLVIFYTVTELFAGFRNDPLDSTAHWAHLGGALVGFLLVWFWNKTNRRTFY